MDHGVVDGALAAEQQRRRRYITVIVMRHGVALHNVPGPHHHPRRLDDPALTDPPLIETGRMQAVHAGTRIAEWLRRQQQQYPLYGSNNDNDTTIDLVVVSPLRRCIETAVLAFLPGGGGATTGAGPPPIRRFVCHEDVREAFGRHYPDKRSEKSILEVRFVVVALRMHQPKRKHGSWR
jgi:hypothetical protein